MSSYAEGSLWFYAPNKGAPIAFAVFFLITGSMHCWQCFHFKSWKTSGLLPWAAVLFVAGFVLREVGAYKYDNVGIYFASTFLLLIAPPIYEAANYFILGRILYYVPYHSPIHPGRVVTTFIGLDAVIGALTGIGAGKSLTNTTNTSQQHLGQSLLKAALLLQIACMALFVSVAGKFHLNCRGAGVYNHKLRNVLVVLYCSCTLITIRTIYRTVEYFAAVSGINNQQSPNAWSPVLRHEWVFWIFEASVMLANSTLLNVFHPLRQLPRSNMIYLARDGVTEIEGPGYLVDKRPFIITLFDPFDIVGLVRGTDKQTRFWETHEDIGSSPQSMH